MDSKLLVLIAEDNEDDAFIIQHALERAGLQNRSHVCRDGTDVMAYLKGDGIYADRDRYPFPRMLLLDLKMPKVNGFDLLRWIQAHPACRVTPTIILSSSNQPADVEEAYRLHVHAYLMKPSSPQAMEALVRSLDAFWSACELPPVSRNCHGSESRRKPE